MWLDYRSRFQSEPFLCFRNTCKKKLQSLEIAINRIDDYGKSMICGVIGKTINEVSYCPGEIHLPEISEMIGDASVNKLHVRSFFDIIEMWVAKFERINIYAIMIHILQISAEKFSTFMRKEKGCLWNSTILLLSQSFLRLSNVKKVLKDCKIYLTK